MAARKKAGVVPQEKYPLSDIAEGWTEIEKAWVHLENTAIIVTEDLGLKAFGGEKIANLRAAVLNLRKERVLDDARTLYRIVKKGDKTPESLRQLKEIETIVARLSEEQIKKAQ